MSSLDTLTAEETSSSAGEWIHRHSRSFSIASRFLPAEIRADVERLYAWCRVCDDAVDNATDQESARRDLDRLGNDIVHRSTSSPDHPASHWMLQLIQECDVDPNHALDLIEGMRMDLDADRIDTDEDLLRYSYHVAGVVGLMMCRVMGVRDPAADRPAMDLGIAMQLTNIARDVLEDAQRGRCYLPGIDDALLAQPRDVERSVQRILKLADNYYDRGRAGIPLLPRSCRRAVTLAANLYQAIGIEIARRNYRVLSGRTILARHRVARVVLKSLLKSNRPVPSQRSLSMTKSPYDARYIAYLGLSLTAFTSTGLFMLVYLNPKESTYSWLPLMYAGISLAIGIACNRLAAKQETAAATPTEKAAA